MQIIEKHEPRYRVETKVAAPVYILPKHGPVYSSSPRLMPGSKLSLLCLFLTLLLTEILYKIASDKAEICSLFVL